MEFNLEELNKKLKEVYGMFDQTNANWRVSWSEQYEKRFGTFHDHYGDILLRVVEETREVRKYPHIHNRWILERCIPIIDEISQKELCGKKFDYYVVWTFEDKNRNGLMPKWIACKYIIEQIHINAANRVGVKYKDPSTDPELSEEERLKESKEIIEALYGNETAIGDALGQKRAVGYSGKAANFSYSPINGENKNG